MEKESKKTNIRVYAKYSGMAFQMIGIILVGVFAGIKLDEKLNTEKPIFTIILSILSVILSVYFAIKDLIKINK